MRTLLMVALSIFSLNTLWAQQKTLTGTVTEKGNDIPLSGVSIVIKNTNQGVISGFDGSFAIDVTEGDMLMFTYIGFEPVNFIVGDQSVMNVEMTPGVSLEEVVLVGSRTPPRSKTETPLPVDVIQGPADLKTTGQVTFDKALQFKVPSFNTVQTPVNDATSLLDPYEIRNMGPSRTLILVNGKRKNLSALLYTQTAPGRGETGADISGIPLDAIKRVEILRDGASAQYGSDAIAGVVNIILKDDASNGGVTFNSGISAKGDGEMFGIGINNGTRIGEDSGFLNYSVDFSRTLSANRPGTVSALGEIADFTSGSAEDAAFVNEFLSRHPDALNRNVSPENVAAKFSLNGNVKISNAVNMYFDALYVYKKVNSFANYRTPYWRTLESFPYLGTLFPGDNPNTNGTYTDNYGNSFQGNGYDGYLPTFEGLLSDYSGTFGFKSERNKWYFDTSITVGGNTQTYVVSDSHNRNEVFEPNFNSDTGNFDAVRRYQENSQIRFNQGGTSFKHVVGNVDVSKTLSEKTSIALGAEFRNETFSVLPGELASYDGGGADSFAGNSPENSGDFNRYNIGAYIDFSWDISERLLLNSAARLENYSDFGNAFVYKLSSLYKLGDNLRLRSSLSTGFRAPTLHQIYTQKLQYRFVPGQGVQVGGLINNVSPQARLLGISRLKPELSENFTFGLAGNISAQMNFTLDYYNIDLRDRIVLGTEIFSTGDPNNSLDALLSQNNLIDLSFFSNALNTRTSGIDLVYAYKNINLGRGYLNLNLSGNYQFTNKRVGEVKNIDIVEQAGQSVVNASQEALFFTSRPKSKFILGSQYNLGKFVFNFNHTYFGKTTFKQDGLNENLRTEFTPKIVSDLAVSFEVSDKTTVLFNVNNIFNILPEWKFVAENSAGQAIIDDTTLTSTGLTPIENQSNLITFNQRYSQMTYDGYHFSQLGTLFNFSVNYRF